MLEAIEEAQLDAANADEAPAAPCATSAPPSEEVEPTVVDRFADAMLAALQSGLQSGLGGGSDGGTASSAESDEQPTDEEGVGERDEPAPQSGAVPRALLWRPELTLPESEGCKGRLRRQAQINGMDRTPAATAALTERKHPGLTKLARVPPQDLRVLNRAARGSVPDTAGKAWYDLPATAVTDEVKNDLRVLRLRAAFDPKTFYKKPDSTKFPKHFQMGTVLESAADFFAGRLTRRERKRTLTEEVMSDPHLTQMRQKRYSKMQDEKAQAGRRKGRKTDNPRLKKKPQRPKH